VTIDHANRYAYVANLGEATISQYKIGLDGALAALTPSKVATGQNPASVYVDPTNKFAYVANFNSGNANPTPGPSTISQYLIGSDGTLAPMSTPTVVSGSSPDSLVVDPTGHYLYVANMGDNNLGQYTINPDGSLTAMTVATIPTGVRPFSVVVDPTAKYVYVANQTDNTISEYTIGAGGALTVMAGSPVAAGMSVSSVTVDPTGKYLYAANRGTTTISQYNISPTDGSLSPMTAPTAASGLHPTAIVTGY
jgi:YVTN family beta-propeller protein